MAELRRSGNEKLQDRQFYYNEDDAERAVDEIQKRRGDSWDVWHEAIFAE